MTLLSSSPLLQTRVELHLHLEGSIRPQTIVELANAKGMQLNLPDGGGGGNSLVEIEKATSIERPRDLAYFLATFAIYMPLLIGDLSAIERIAYELCEDQAAQGVLYFETRFSPHGLAGGTGTDSGTGSVTPEAVIRAVWRGVSRGQKDFNLIARLILCGIKGQPTWTADIVDLAARLGNECGIVGIDLAGIETVDGFTTQEVAAFQRAAKLGIHRTVHAGESGPAANVHQAVTQMYAERIGHGYHVVDDEQVYALIRERGIHLETCPYSSYYTGAVQFGDYDAIPFNGAGGVARAATGVATNATTKPHHYHPIVRFAKDNVNFSISKDDPTQTKSTLSLEYSLVQRWGLTEAHLIRANLNAARSCFLPPEEKHRLLVRLYRLYGFVIEDHQGDDDNDSGRRS